MKVSDGVITFFPLQGETVVDGVIRFVKNNPDLSWTQIRDKIEQYFVLLEVRDRETRKYSTIRRWHEPMRRGDVRMDRDTYCLCIHEFQDETCLVVRIHPSAKTPHGEWLEKIGRKVIKKTRKNLKKQR